MAKPIQRPRFFEKKIISRKVSTRDRRVFKVEKYGAAEVDVELAFSREVDFRVVKLSTKTLPERHAGRKVHWLSAFGVLDAHGKFMKRVHYTAFLCAPPGRSIVRFEHGKVKAEKHPGKGVFHIHFDSGDPAIGVT